MTMPLGTLLDLEIIAATTFGIFQNGCSEEPPYQTVKELREGLKQKGEGAQLLLIFFLRLRSKNEQTRCSGKKAIA